MPNDESIASPWIRIPSCLELAMADGLELQEKTENSCVFSHNVGALKIDLAGDSFSCNCASIEVSGDNLALAHHLTGEKELTEAEARVQSLLAKMPMKKFARHRDSFDKRKYAVFLVFWNGETDDQSTIKEFTCLLSAREISEFQHMAHPGKKGLRKDSFAILVEHLSGPFLQKKPAAVRKTMCTDRKKYECLFPDGCIKEDGSIDKNRLRKAIEITQDNLKRGCFTNLVNEFSRCFPEKDATAITKKIWRGRKIKYNRMIPDSCKKADRSIDENRLREEVEIIQDNLKRTADQARDKKRKTHPYSCVMHLKCLEGDALRAVSEMWLVMPLSEKQLNRLIQKDQPQKRRGARKKELRLELEKPRYREWSDEKTESDIFKERPNLFPKNLDKGDRINLIRTTRHNMQRSKGNPC